jgi:hypothetical protein
VRVSAEANHLRQGYGGPPKLYAKAEASALRRIEGRASVLVADMAVLENLSLNRGNSC